MLSDLIAHALFSFSRLKVLLYTYFRADYVDIFENKIKDVHLNSIALGVVTGIEHNQCTW